MNYGGISRIDLDADFKGETRFLPRFWETAGRVSIASIFQRRLPRVMLTLTHQREQLRLPWLVRRIRLRKDGGRRGARVFPALLL